MFIFLARHKLSGCKVMGCNGKGNMNNSSRSEHNVVKDCPYELDGWQLTVAGLTKLPDRLENVQILPNITTGTRYILYNVIKKKCN